MPPENINIKQKIVEEIGIYRRYAEMALKDRKKFNERNDIYDLAIAELMSCPPFKWDDKIASLDEFCKITTTIIPGFRSALFKNSSEEVKLHFTEGAIWTKELICGGPINVTPFVFHKLADKLVISPKDNLWEKVSLHILNPNMDKIKAHHLASAFQKEMGPKSTKLFDEIMKSTLRKA